MSKTSAQHAFTLVVIWFLASAFIAPTFGQEEVSPEERAAKVKEWGDKGLYEPGQERIRVNIPFEFTVSGKVLPAGNYSFIPSNDGMTVKVVGQKHSAVAVVLTRLAAGIHTSPENSHIIIDKIGDKHFLSEIWIPGVDAFVLNATKEQHTHQILNVPVTKK
jgi:hypothetical protein